jgi:hypothetical protein
LTTALGLDHQLPANALKSKKQSIHGQRSRHVGGVVDGYANGRTQGLPFCC